MLICGEDKQGPFVLSLGPLCNSTPFLPRNVTRWYCLYATRPLLLVCRGLWKLIGTNGYANLLPHLLGSCTFSHCASQHLCQFERESASVNLVHVECEELEADEHVIAQ